MTQKEISPLVETLGLQPHVEGGWYKRLWNSPFEIPKDTLGEAYSGPRASASSIYFLLHADETSDWHTVLSSEIWLYHSGSPIVLSLGRQRRRAGERNRGYPGSGYRRGPAAAGSDSSRCMAGRASARRRAGTGLLHRIAGVPF